MITFNYPGHYQVDNIYTGYISTLHPCFVVIHEKIVLYSTYKSLLYSEHLFCVKRKVLHDKGNSPASAPASAPGVDFQDLILASVISVLLQGVSRVLSLSAVQIEICVLEQNLWIVLQQVIKLKLWRNRSRPVFSNCCINQLNECCNQLCSRAEFTEENI